MFLKDASYIIQESTILINEIQFTRIQDASGDKTKICSCKYIARSRIIWVVT